MDKQEGGNPCAACHKALFARGFLFLAYGLRKMSGWKGFGGFLANFLSRREEGGGQAMKGTLSETALQCPWSAGQPECASHCQDAEATISTADRWRSDPDASPSWAYLTPIVEDPVDIPLSSEWTLAWVLWVMVGVVVTLVLVIIGGAAGLFLAFR